jgi:hypothetical protein
MISIARRQSGFVPGFVMEINFALAALGMAVAVLWPWSANQFRPLTIEPRAAELVAASPAGVAVVPEGWAVERGRGGSIAIQRIELPALRWIVPALLVCTVIAIFACPLQLPFWLLLAALCATWGYAIRSGPIEQSVTIHADGSVALRGSAHLAGWISREEIVAGKDVDTVLVHKADAVAYVVFLKGKTRFGWRIYAASQTDARAVAGLVLSGLTPPATPPGLPAPKS